MGAETSSTHLIFFIVAMIIAGGVVSVIYTNVNTITRSSGEGAARLSEQLRTDITIINDPANIPKSGNNYTFYVKNTGKSTLSHSFINVIINGQMVPDSNVTKTVVDGITVWRPSEVLKIEVTYSSMLFENKIRIITENGIEDTLEFTT